MPEIARSWEQLWLEDLLPYRRLHRQMAFVMVSHAAYPLVEKSDGPASTSKYWITDILRKKVGYRGLVLSDDMEMGGVLGSYSIEDATIAAIAAGTHLIEVCKEPALILRAYEAVLAEAEHSAAFRRKVRQAAEHVRRQRERLLKRDVLPAIATASKLDHMRERIQRYSETVAKKGKPTVQ
jgi:beta-N-acetylhexosaminidase